MRDDDEYPNSDPEIDFSERTLHRAQWTWRMCLLLPFCYLGIAWLVEKWCFDAAHHGFLPLRRDKIDIFISIFAGLVVAAQITLILLRSRFAAVLHRRESSKMETAYLYWKRTLWLLCCADIPSGLGLILFLLFGYWCLLIAFSVCSYLLYAQAYPRARILTE
ncbi:TPA: hypothetical protein DDW35_12190 [Candidatus Sumerlaeota bacterium]|nr:hypothetical protein [Candidatus Sumerlaeota bacterium]